MNFLEKKPQLLLIFLERQRSWEGYTSQTFHKLIVTICGRMGWIRITKNHTTSLTLLANVLS